MTPSSDSRTLNPALSAFFRAFRNANPEMDGKDFSRMAISFAVVFVLPATLKDRIRLSAPGLKRFDLDCARREFSLRVGMIDL